MNSSDEDKENDAYQFARRYKNNIADFITFISESDFSVKDDYIKSWKFIKKDLNSLHRYTNLAIGLPKLKQEE